MGVVEKNGVVLSEAASERLESLSVTRERYNKRVIEQKLSRFEKKYQKNFEEFERSIFESEDEDFEKWDDYLEWKAYQKAAEDLDID